MSNPTWPTNFGICVPTLHSVNVSPTVSLEHDLALFQRADELGLQEGWVGEHHSSGHEMIGCPEIFLAAAAGRTRQLRLGTAVNSLSFHNPFLVAERLVLLDHLSHGRAIMGFGPGLLSSDAHMFGIDPMRQRQMMAESAPVVLALLRGETVTVETDWFTLRDACLQILPYSRPTMDTVVAALVSPSGPMLSGSLGIGMINLAAFSPEAFKAIKTHWAVAEQEAEKHNQTISRQNWRMASIMHLAETEEQGRKDLEYGFEELYNVLSHLGPNPELKGTTLEERVIEASSRFTIATPKTLIEMIEGLAEHSGGFGSFIMVVGDFVSFGSQMKALELFAERVVPHFRGQLESLRASSDWVLGVKDTETTTSFRTQYINAKDDFMKKHADILIEVGASTEH